MTDLVERLREAAGTRPGQDEIETALLEAAEEIERLRELLRGTGANRYWEGRWRDDQAEIEELRKTVQHLQTTLEHLEKIA